MTVPEISERLEAIAAKYVRDRFERLDSVAEHLALIAKVIADQGETTKKLIDEVLGVRS